MLGGCFVLSDRKVQVSLDRRCLVTEAAEQAEIVLNTSCAGLGTCGGCAVDLLGGAFEVNAEQVTIKPGHKKRVLGCQTRIVSDNWQIAVPRRSLVQTGQFLVAEFDLPTQPRLNPLVRKIALRLPPPSLEDSVGDFERICRALRDDHGFDRIRPTIQVLQKLPELMVQADYELTVTLAENYGLWEIIQVEPGDTCQRLFVVAADIGTTTVACSLVDLSTGKIVDSASSYNQQVQRCEDVASRIIYAQRAGGLKELQRLIVAETLNKLIHLLGKSNGVPSDQIARLVVSGNTIMGHLLLGVNPKNMGGVPFQPGISYPGTFRASPLGVDINPAGFVDLVPGISAYVGGDITSDIHLAGLIENDKLALVIDVGTNAEIALGNRKEILACATPAGPAFEGGGITCGLRACDGAIEAIRIDPKTLAAGYDVIGGIRPSGICGTGLIDFIAEARRVGLIDRAGRFQTDLSDCKALRRTRNNGNSILEYVIVPREQTEDGLSDLVITEKDIERLLQAKAVIYAGAAILVKAMQVSWDQIERIYLAGGFAKRINVPNAVTIGMLPDVPLEKYHVLGNASLAGAYLGAVDAESWATFDRIVTCPTVIELNKDPDFEDEFTFALFLPNLQTERFPRVMAQLDKRPRQS